MNSAYKIKFIPAANEDLRNAVLFYHDISPILSKRFIKEIDLNINLIKSKPLLFPIKIQNFRIAPLKKFPFIIGYYIDNTNKSIQILSVFHTSQNPKTLQKRFEK
jgi:plasmid stabilization system protein ParE